MFFHRVCFLTAWAFVAGHAGHPSAAAAPPATAAEAAVVLDLSTFPLVAPEGEPNSRLIASQSYTAQGTIRDVAGSVRSQLLAAGFRELEGATIADSHASAMYERDGFAVSLSVSPGQSPATVSVSLRNHGNVDLTTLPVPASAKQLYMLQAMIAYVTDVGVQEANRECRQMLASQGWEPFGETTSSFFMKKNAVRLQVAIQEAPGLDGKTSIQFSTEQLSADLPAPPDFEWLQYSDSTGGMLFDSQKTQAELVAYFKIVLQPEKWVATTEQPIRIGFRDHLIFRNPQQAMIQIQFYEVDGKTRVDLNYSTPTQVAEREKKLDAKKTELQRKRDAEMERKKNPPKVVVTAPADATVAEKSPTSIEFSTASGAAKASVERWIQELEAKGWKKSVTIDTKEFADVTLKKAELQLDVSFIDPGFIPGSITISVSGDYQLELAR